MISKTYAVDGMSCQHCVNAVTKEVSGLPGVADVSVALEQGAVTVTSDEALDDDAVAAAVDAAGYALRR